MIPGLFLTFKTLLKTSLGTLLGPFETLSDILGTSLDLFSLLNKSSSKLLDAKALLNFRTIIQDSSRLV